MRLAIRYSRQYRWTWFKWSIGPYHMSRCGVCMSIEIAIHYFFHTTGGCHLTRFWRLERNSPFPSERLRRPRAPRAVCDTRCFHHYYNNRASRQKAKKCSYEAVKPSAMSLHSMNRCVPGKHYKIRVTRLDLIYKTSSLPSERNRRSFRW